MPPPEVQIEWIESINVAVESAKNSNDVVLFLDPMHQIHNNENDYCWQEKGKLWTKNVLSNSGRRRLNIIGALNADSLIPTILLTEDNCDTEMIKSFLMEVRREYPVYKHKSITIFLDNARYNKSYETQAFAISLWIKLKFLPPYSPNLNLIERLWRFFKKKMMKNKYYPTFEEFYKKIIKFFQNIEIYMDELISLLTLNFEVIKAS